MSEQERGITAISVSGFKSLREESRIEIRPLTILAGANSSGKSSIMQPLLLMKQTLEAPYDPGPLLLNGPNVSFTSVEQFLWRNHETKQLDFTVGIETNQQPIVKFRFRKAPQDQNRPIQVVEIISERESELKSIRSDMTQQQLTEIVPRMFEELRQAWEERYNSKLEWRMGRSRFFLGFDLYDASDKEILSGPLFTDIGGIDEGWILGVIHVPGLRPNPQRNHPHVVIEEYVYRGTFENYVASILNQWQEEEDTRIYRLAQILRRFGLTSQVIAKPLDDTQIEIRVGRTLNSDEQDTVSIADVGFGVSQVLPVLVALLVAEPGQLVYLEQPELHLHPRAQVALAEVLADAANRGVRVVAETHSSLLLLGVQTLIAEGKLPPDKVMLHWFARDDEGKTHITSVEPDENGAYGDWPEDFADVELDAQSRYLDTVASHEMGI